MAKQAGSIFIAGSIGNICFYKMDGEYYARGKSSLCADRVKQDPVFMKTMWYSRLLGEASKMASTVYRAMPKAERRLSDYRRLTGEYMQKLKRGMDLNF